VPAAIAGTAVPPTAAASKGKRRFIIEEAKAVTARIKTADGTEWHFTSSGEKSGQVISCFLSIMGADDPPSPLYSCEPSDCVRNIQVRVFRRQIAWRDFPAERSGKILCRLGPFSTKQLLGFQILRLSRVVAHYCEKAGGLLLHGALAAREGSGVVLAGPGGVGKTTAIRRLPPPWRALSDDATLIVRGPDGTYWAHPWPTWSRVRRGELKASWNVQRAVKLGLIGMLSQGKPDRMSAMSYLRAVSELVDVSGQASHNLFIDMDVDARKRINRMRFHNAEAIAREIPIMRLEISRNGRFWEVIEEHLGRANIAMCTEGTNSFRLY